MLFRLYFVFEQTAVPQKNLIENYVLSQHLAVATSRYDGKSQRLRITIEEDGLAALSTEPWKPRISDDRLDTVLSLMSECDLIAYSEEQEGYYAL